MPIIPTHEPKEVAMLNNFWHYPSKYVNIQVLVYNGINIHVHTESIHILKDDCQLTMTFNSI